MTTSRRVWASVVALLLPASVFGQAQREPTMVPTVVARAMTLGLPPMTAKTKFFVGRPPTSWPAALVPRGARAVGGGTMGDSAFFPMSVAVFEFPRGADPEAAMHAIVAAAGYAQFSRTEETHGGFLSTTEARRATPYCKGLSSLLAFGLADSATTRRTLVVSIIGGEAARQNCASRADVERMRSGGIHSMGPKNVPPLEAPRGTLSIPGGSSWSGSNGEIRSELRTTMPIDSILTHYSAQLVRAGWKAEGSQLADAKAGIQRFTFRDGADAWSAMLLIVAVGEQRQVGLRLSKVLGE